MTGTAGRPLRDYFPHGVTRALKSGARRAIWQALSLADPRLQDLRGKGVPDQMNARFASALDLASALRPVEPVLCLRPRTVTDQARAFLDGFPGSVLYAVKCNDDPLVLRALVEGGVRQFDVASLGEIETVREVLPDAALYYMHPVKPPEAIEAAGRTHGVRCFALDHPDEFAKIRRALGTVSGLELMVRIAVTPGPSVCDLGGKFGADPQLAAELLQAIVAAGARPGLTFHVGSQCMSPSAYGDAVAMAAGVARSAGVRIGVLDVGGGFPSTYSGLSPQPLAAYVDAVVGAMRAGGLEDADLRAEPGRALAAAAASALVRVELRKDDALYLNDGVYGTLSELKFPDLVLPMRLVRPDGPHSSETAGFRLYGPTCDSLDAAAGPFHLPADVRAGDWIEVGQVGAYGAVLSTRFNGMVMAATAILADDPPPCEIARTVVAFPGGLAMRARRVA